MNQGAPSIRRASKTNQAEVVVLHPRTMLRMNIVQTEGMVVLQSMAMFEVDVEAMLRGDYFSLLAELQGKRLTRGDILNHYVRKLHPAMDIYGVGINGQPHYLQLTPTFWRAEP